MLPRQPCATRRSTVGSEFRVDHSVGHIRLYISKPAHVKGGMVEKLRQFFVGFTGAWAAALTLALATTGIAVADSSAPLSSWRYRAPTITEYPTPHQHGVFYPALGPDGNIWDVDADGTIVRILTYAPYTVTVFDVPGGFYLRTSSPARTTTCGSRIREAPMTDSRSRGRLGGSPRMGRSPSSAFPTRGALRPPS